jgi:hypothetical protein
MSEGKKEIMPTHETKTDPNPEPIPQDPPPQPKIMQPGRFSDPCPDPDPKKGWNWRSTLPGFAGICSVLAGFSVAFIALLLTGQVANIQIGVASLTFGQIAILLFGISAGLLIGAEEFLVHAIEFDVYALPQSLSVAWQKALHEKFDKNVETQTEALYKNAGLARTLYNVAIFLVFIGLGFAIAPYSILIAIIVAGVGLLIEIIQILIMRSKPVAA